MSLPSSAFAPVSGADWPTTISWARAGAAAGLQILRQLGGPHVHPLEDEAVLVHLAKAVFVLVFRIGADDPFDDRMDRHVRRHVPGETEEPADRLCARFALHLPDLRHTGSQQCRVVGVVHAVSPPGLARSQVRVVGTHGAELEVAQVQAQRPPGLDAEDRVPRLLLRMVDDGDVCVGAGHAASPLYLLRSDSARP